MDWAEIQAQVGLISANGQVAMLAAFKRDDRAMSAALEQVEQALKRVAQLRAQGES